MPSNASRHHFLTAKLRRIHQAMVDFLSLVVEVCVLGWRRHSIHSKLMASAGAGTTCRLSTFVACQLLFNQGDLNVDLRWSQQKQEAVIDSGDDGLSTNVSFVSKPARKEWATGANDKGKVLAVNWFNPIEALAKGCEALPKGGKSAQAT